MKNQAIREAAQKAGVCLWQIAELEHISEFTFCRRLRHELSEADTARIMGHIANISAQNGGGAIDA